MPEIKEKYGVKNLYIFGTYVRGEQTPESDIDILVEFEKGKKTFKNYMGLKFYLEELFRRKVDLIIKEAVKPRLKKYIYEEAISV
nr:nucleotidyltransferase family protein [Persephonella sp.]